MSKFKDYLDRIHVGMTDGGWADEFSPSSRTVYLPRIQTWMLQVLTGEGGMPHINRGTSDKQVMTALQELTQLSESDLFDTSADTHDDLYLKVPALRDVCPGDIANVLRKWELHKDGDTDRPPRALQVQWLREECAHKAKPTMGFTHGARS